MEIPPWRLFLLTIQTTNRNKQMNHPFLHPVDPGNKTIPVCYDRLQAWLDRLPGWFSSDVIPTPKAVLLCGLPGSGKGSTVKAIAGVLNRSLFRLDPGCPASVLAEILTLLAAEKQPGVLWIDQPSGIHSGIHRCLLDCNMPPAFLVLTTHAPHRLPEEFLRADVVESVWHLDLPDNRQRCALWHDVIKSANPGYHSHDTVRLAQLSIRFTAGEVRAAFDHATREAGGFPDEGTLIDSILALRPIAHSMDESLACLRHWAVAHALDAASGAVRSEQ